MKITTILLLMFCMTEMKAQESKEHYLITNASGYIVAKMIVINNDIQEIRDCRGVYLGEYIARYNKTFDSHGNQIGTGNLILNNEKEEFNNED